MSHLVGTLILLGILMFIVYRILQTLNNQTQYSRHGGGEGGKVYHMPERRAPAPPRSISLETVPEDQDPFTDEVCEEASRILIDKGGLEFIGAYSVKQMPGYFLGAFTHPEHSLIGILYKDPKDLTWVNLITEYEDGRIITSSGAEDVSKAPRPKGMPLFNYPGLPIEQLLRRHKLETRGSKKKSAKPADQFPQFFADNYARLRESQRASENSEQDKVNIQTGALPPPAPVNRAEEGPVPDGVSPSPALLHKWLDIIYSHVKVPVENRSQFQRELVWVVQDATMPSIAGTISEYAGVLVDEVEKGRWVIRSKSGAEDIIEPGKLKGPALFEKINTNLPTGNRFFPLPIREIDGVSFYSRHNV